ncbi:hypothetical protein ACLBWT_18365 [Paenibacillus sp. D51F]
MRTTLKEAEELVRQNKLRDDERLLKVGISQSDIDEYNNYLMDLEKEEIFLEKEQELFEMLIEMGVEPTSIAFIQLDFWLRFIAVRDGIDVVVSAISDFTNTPIGAGTKEALVGIINFIPNDYVRVGVSTAFSTVWSFLERKSKK